MSSFSDPTKDMRGSLWIFTLCLLALSAFDGAAALSFAATNCPTLDALKARWGKLSDDDLRRAAEAGNAEAQYMYGSREWDMAHKDSSVAGRFAFRAVADGRNLTEEQIKTFDAKWRSVPDAELRAAAERGEKGALYVLGSVGASRASDRALKGFEWMRRSAEQSFALAEASVAIRYLGLAGWLVVPGNLDEGLKWLERSSDHGCGAASQELARVYLRGKWKPRDVERGIEYLQRAVAQGDADAAVGLAERYAAGMGTAPSGGPSVIYLLQIGARATNAYALHHLAEYHRVGTELEKDYVRAIQLYLQSERLLPADLISGMLDDQLQPIKFLNGDLLPFAQVFSTYQRAVQRNDPGAMAQIGRMYLQGTVVPMSKFNACCWFNLAIRNGYQDTSKECARLEAALSIEERRKVTEWVGSFRGRQMTGGY